MLIYILTRIIVLELIHILHYSTILIYVLRIVLFILFFTHDDNRTGIYCSINLDCKMGESSNVVLLQPISITHSRFQHTTCLSEA